MNEKTLENLVHIQGLLSQDEILAQLMEECAELIQAAAKLRRNLNPENPTTTTGGKARREMVEEFADVMVCLEALYFFDEETKHKIEEIFNFKAERWAKRLQERKACVPW